METTPGEEPGTPEREHNPIGNAQPTFAAGHKPPPGEFRKPLIVIVRKKRKSHAAGAHGGSWKIAYADFVTAMMAFFLLMWLLSSTNHGDLQGIADYFNRPLQALFTEGPGASATTSPQTAEQVEAQKRKSDEDQLTALKTKIHALIEQSPKLRAFKNQIRIDITSEGLRIQIVDAKNRPMFDKGVANLKDYTTEILHEIGTTLNNVGNRVTITGHTDSLKYSGDIAGYSNWELSSERANAARRALLSGGMQANKLLQIRGMADALPLIKNDPTNPANRRISIVVLNKRAEANFLRDGAPAAPGGAPASPAP